MNRSKNRLQIEVLEETPGRYWYVAHGHHKGDLFAQSVRDQEGLPEWTLPDFDPCIQQVYLDRNNRIHETKEVGTYPATIWMEPVG